MADIFGISLSALQAFQQALTVTSNNVANANTPGYSEESIHLATAPGQQTGSGFIGSGVDVVSVTRAFSQAATNQLNSSQSALGLANSLQSYTSQIDNLFGANGAGVTSALQNFFNAASTLADSPGSTAAREAFLGQAQTLSASFQNVSGQLDSLSADINTKVSADISQINSDAQSIAQLNQQIVTATGSSLGQPPNELLDQRDQLINQLSSLVSVSTTQNSDGSLNVYVGSGQGLVLQSKANPLTTVADQFIPTQVDVGSSGTGNNSINASITGGDLGGLLAARSQVIAPLRNQLGQIAAAITQSVNAQQNAGLDLTGALGKNLFSVAGPQVLASANNTDGTTVTASITNLGALTTNDYILTYNAGTYTLRNAATGATVPTAGAGTAASPLSADGLSLVVSATPANGDQFLIQPTAAAAGSLSAVLTNPAQVAAAGAVLASAATTNTGSGTITPGSVVDATNPNLLTPVTIAFTSPTTYSINGAGSFAYAPGGTITDNGWQVQISGTPATGDTFTIKPNTAGASGDNRNALALAALQNQKLLTGGSISISGALSVAVTNIGTLAQQANSNQTAQATINNQALQNVQSVSGVNLNEEAANLLKWQNAYEAAAQALKVGSTLFQTMLAAVQAG